MMLTEEHMDALQKKYNKRLKNHRHKKGLAMAISPPKEKSLADFRSFKHESLNQGTMKSRRAGGNTSKTRKAENR